MNFDNDHDELILYADNDEPLYRRKKASRTAARKHVRWAARS